jgi:hypothetical protein
MSKFGFLPCRIFFTALPFVFSKVILIVLLSDPNGLQEEIQLVDFTGVNSQTLPQLITECF